MQLRDELSVMTHTATICFVGYSPKPLIYYHSLSEKASFLTANLKKYLKFAELHIFFLCFVKLRGKSAVKLGKLIALFINQNILVKAFVIVAFFLHEVISFK